jgi:hypothetical protein
VVSDGIHSRVRTGGTNAGWRHAFSVENSVMNGGVSDTAKAKSAKSTYYTNMHLSSSKQGDDPFFIWNPD